MKYSRYLIATLLMSGGLLQLVSPAVADGTASGTAITNTATASYEDPTGVGNINTTSNPVTVTVAEVAGISVSASGITNKSNPGGAVVVNDQLYFNYTITNVGNAPTQFQIPGNPGVTGPGTLTGVEYSTDGGTTWVSAATGATTPSVVAGGTVLVRVSVTANNSGGSTIAVQLGNTPGNAANQPFSASGNGDDVNTVGGNPANGVRESAASQKINIGAIVKNIALATVLEKRTREDDNGTPAIVNDDIISYELGLRVESADVTNTGITPVPLAGTPITLDGTPNVTRILVSSAIPNGTVLTAVAAPSGWKAVYTTDDPALTIATTASWSTTFDPTKVYKRIGFVNDPSVSTTVPIGTIVTGLTFKVKTVNATGSGYTVDSMTQLFGTSALGDPTAIVYDESGDQTPNNYDGTTPLSPSTSTLTVAVTSGSANGIATATYGIDAGNDNTGSGTAGEINEYVYNYTPAAPTSLLNGPIGVPTATGPDAIGTLSTNYDFTNKSSAVGAGIAPGGQIDPAPVGFFNTVKNTGTGSADISLLPELSTVAGAATLPTGTKVKIYTTGASAQFAIYTVTATGFTFTSGSAGISATNPVKLLGVAPSVTADYQVEIDLAGSTDLSTTTGKGFPVVINAFTGGTLSATGDVGVTAPTSSNKTIDRVYTGFVKLLKETRILLGSGPAVAAADLNFSTTAKTPAKGNIIEYRITYSNISEKQIGSGNSILNAANLTIVEDGTTTLSTWGQDKDLNGVIDTSNVLNSAANTDPSAIVKFYNDISGQSLASDLTGLTVNKYVTKYIDTLTTVLAPGNSGSFSFKRQLN
jgi:hypothetical protein